MGDFSGCYIKVLYTLCRNQKQIYEIIKNNGPTLFASITHHVKSVAHFLFATKEKKNKLRSHVALTFGYKTVLAAHALLATFPLLDLVCWRTFCVAVFLSSFTSYISFGIIITLKVPKTFVLLSVTVPCILLFCK